MSGRVALLILGIWALAYAQVSPPPQNASAPGLPPTSPQNATAPGSAPATPGLPPTSPQNATAPGSAPAAPGLPPSSPQNATAPGGLPPTGPSAPSPVTTPSGGQPSNISVSSLPGAGQELPPEPSDVQPAQPQSACNITRAIVAAMNDFNINTTLPLFSRDAVVVADDSKHDYLIQVRGKRRINSFLRANLLFLGLFGPTNFTIVQTQVDQPDRCVAVGMMSSEMLRNCPGTANSSIYAILDITTQNGLVKSVNRTIDSAQHQLVDECIANKLNQTGSEQFD